MNAIHPDSAYTRVSASSLEDWLKGLSQTEAADFGEIFPEAIAVVRREGRASTAAIEAQLNVSYCRAARMVDAMERLGIIPPQICSRPRGAGWDSSRLARAA